MQEASIEDLAYLMNEAKEQNLSQPIFFLGAGASKSGNIPLAGEISEKILSDYKKSPKIKKLKKDKIYPYSELMNCLTPFERNKLLKDYIDNAKINVTHTYLAQLMKENFVDYVLTVNFDNLMLKALALYNEFPPIYDMAILNDLTTTTFKKKSVIYLHGQHHGLWLLNTYEELKKVQNVITPILNSIKNRPWVFIGYSGEDPIFDHVKKLGRFDKGLYWVTYQDNNPSEKVCSNLLDKELTNCFVIKGYDSDSFMIKLNKELKLDQPKIIEQPFSSLKEILNNIVDIDEKGHYKEVKERLEIAKADVETAINQFEKGQIEPREKLQDKTDINILKKKIIDYILDENFEESIIKELEEKSKQLNNNELTNLISSLYNSWGISLHNLAKLNSDKSLYNESCEKYEQATILNPKNDISFSNWGLSLHNLAELNSDKSLYIKAFEKYEQATILNPKNDIAFYNWGLSLHLLAKLNSDKSLYIKAFEKYEQATILNPKKDIAFSNWGNSLHDLAKLNKDESLYKKAIEKYEHATILNPKKDIAFYNWGNSLYDLAKLTSDESLYNKAFEKYEQATILNPKDDSAFSNWGNSLHKLAKLNKDESLYKKAFEKYEQAFKISGISYNLSCLYAVKDNKIKALEYLENSLKNKEIELDFVKNDNDFINIKEDLDFINLIKRYK